MLYLMWVSEVFKLYFTQASFAQLDTNATTHSLANQSIDVMRHILAFKEKTFVFGNLMNTLRTFIYILILTLVSCKSTSKLTLFYGTQENLLIYSNKEMAKGDLNFLIGDYKFIMNFSDFKESFDAINKEHFYSPLDVKIPNKRLFSIIDNNDYIIINLTDTLRNNDGYDLYPFLDHLFKCGKMYFEKSGVPLPFLEYIHWNPQYQGTEYSKWNDNKKVIKEFKWALVD